MRMEEKDLIKHVRELAGNVDGGATSSMTCARIVVDGKEYYINIKLQKSILK